MKKNEEKGLMILIGSFLMNLLFFTLLISTLFFIVKIPVSPLNLYLSIVCSVIFCFFHSNRSIKRTILVTAIGLGILLTVIVFSQQIIDWSWDGNRYHKSIAALLKNGWDPLYESFYEFSSSHFDFLETATETWHDSYPKGSEIWVACIYSITQNIESGKCFTLIATIALFCICCAFLKETKLLTCWQRSLCSLFSVLNPVVFAQALSHDNDGFLWQMFLLCFVALLYLSFLENGKYKKLSCYFIVVSISIGFNIKFSALIYFAILCISFFGYLIVTKIREQGFNKKSRVFIRKWFSLFAAAVILGTCIMGATSYVTNIIRYHNPVYTMIGEGSTEIITSIMPKAYRDKNNVLRFIGSMFSRTNSSVAVDKIEWKLPFTFDAEEFQTAGGCFVRVAGWGILFSGIFLLSLFVLWLAMIKHSDTHPKEIKLLKLLLFVSAISIIFVPGLSWARYSGYLFYLPIGALICLFIWSNSKRDHSQTASFVSGILVALLTLNMAPNWTRNISAFIESKETYEQLEEFRALTKNANVTVGIGSGSEGFEGRFFTLLDLGITDYTYGQVVSENCSGRLFKYCGLYYDVTYKELEVFLDSLREDQDDKLVLIAVKDEGSKALTEEIIQKMRDLGLSFGLQDQYRCSYLAVLDGQHVLYEDVDEDLITYKGTASGKEISMTSAGYLVGNTASIQIDGVEYAKNERGLNIVVIDKRTGNLIDSISADTFSDDRISR